MSQIGFFPPKRPIFFHRCAACSELPSNISTMWLMEEENNFPITAAKFIPQRNLSSGVADPGRFYPDPDLTFKTTNPDLTFKKTRIRIRP